ncbi:MAG: GIY-YIG nuclease family protein [Chitinophagales bacterium]
MTFYTYILQSQTTSQLYIGQTNNLEDRLKRHNGNRNKATKGKGPCNVIFSKEFETRSEAMRLERKLKSYKNKDYILQWIDKQNNLQDWFIWF